MHCSVIIRMDNATFEDNPGAELSRMLRDVAEVAAGDVFLAEPMRLYDANGSAVGWFAVSEDDPPK